MSETASIAIAAVCDRPVFLRGTNQACWRFHSFSIAPDRPSFHRLQDSAFSSPARYVQEIFLRLADARSPDLDGGHFIFNPYFAISRSGVLAAIAALRECDLRTGPPVVLADGSGFPLGYFLPAQFDIEDARYLAFLSTTDASLDAQLLQQVCFSYVAVHSISQLRLAKSARNGFDDMGLPRVYVWIAQQAVRLLEASHTSAQTERSAMKAARLAIPITAFMPHHAGDVLFFSLAFNLLRAPCQRIAVNRSYADIIDTVAPGLTSVVLDTPPLNRDRAFATGKAMRDEEYFLGVVSKLPADSFYVYCRPSRNYNATEFHLMDHFGFALGHGPRDSSQLLLMTRPPPAPPAPSRSRGQAIRILLHFDGGWPLKVYPPKMQAELIELLLAQGHEITVLAAAGFSYPGVKSVTFSSLQSFVALAHAHDAIIGMDSFPSHYCAHVLGVPTLCLFANTKPANSNASASARYTYMERGLNCRPCYAIVQCPAYGGTECRNFSDPVSVTEQLNSLLTGKLPLMPDLAHPKTPEPTTLPSSMTISLRLIKVQLWVARFAPETSYWRFLAQEFHRAIQREGLRGALARARRFLLRKYFSFK